MKVRITVLMMFLTTIGFSQQDQLIKNVIYKVGLYGKKGSKEKNDKKTIEDISITDIEESMMELEYRLLFNNQMSSFELIDKGYYDEFKYKMAITISGGSKKYYIDRNENNIYKKVNFSGQSILIKSAIKDITWEISNETKMIGNYKCTKATTNIEYYSKVKDALLSFNPVVWFANDIPVNYGPSNLVGLPGLVLEGTYNGRLYFYATEILNDKSVKKSELQLSKKGKIMSPEEYEDFLYQYGG